MQNEVFVPESAPVK